MAPDRGRLSIFLPIVVGLVVWLYRRVGFPVMSFPPVCRFLRAVSGECGVEVSSGDGLVRFASSSTVTRRCFCLRCSFSVGGCFLPGGGAVGAVAAGSVSRAGGVYSVSSFGPSLGMGARMTSPSTSPMSLLVTAEVGLSTNSLRNQVGSSVPPLLVVCFPSWE